MDLDSVLVAVVLGTVQGVLEWLPVSSEGGVALVSTALGAGPAASVRFALFLHLGTALAATTFYRDDLRHLLSLVSGWHPPRAFTPRDGHLTFLAASTFISGLVGVAAYVLFLDAVTSVTGGAFVALIGALVVVTGGIQRAADAVSLERAVPPRTVDAVLVGVGQGLAVLPGISRSGTTVGLLLLRGHDGETALRLSFLLSVPASVGAGALAIVDSGLGDSPAAWGIALLVSAAVGYLTIGALMAVVRRVAFWAVCIGVGGVAVLGGILVWLG